MARLRWPPLALATLVLVAACGGGSRSRDQHTPGAATGRATATAAAAKAADATEIAVIRGWADALRTGHVNAAARYFALPALVSNNTAPIQLKSFADVRYFNATLPCGARLVNTERSVHHFVIATFRLTERTGPGGGGCGAGAGNLARTAFLIQRRHISQWFRVPDPAPGSPAAGGSAS